MVRSITVERSVPALLGLARVSRIGTARHGHRFFCCIRALRWTSKNHHFKYVYMRRCSASPCQIDFPIV